MERNITLDYFKVILSILVITIHIGTLSASFPIINWLIAQGVARIAVPCFFIINGYYLVKKVDNKKAIKKYLLHLLLVYLVWNTFYILIHHNEQTGLVSILRTYLLGYHHLWYVSALLEGCCLLFVIKKMVENDTIILIASVLFLLIAIVYESTFEVRNVLIGFPFIFFGYYIQTKNLPAKVKDIYLVPIILISFVTLCIEACIIARRADTIHDIYYSLIVFCPAIIIFVIKHAKYKKYDNIYLLYLGSLASAIYFIHIFVISMLSGIEIQYMLIRFTIVCLISFILSIFIIYINKYVKVLL